MPSTIQEPLVAFEAIHGMYTAELTRYRDDRGAFMETFRREWFPWVNWDRMQINQSQSKAGVLRGLHYHFHQIDYWLVVAGSLRVGLADLRTGSPTYQQSATVDLHAEDGRGLFIPVGVAHGFYALSDVTLFYVVNNYYDGGKDEHGVAWNDPTLAVDWQATSPTLSERDRQNANFADLAAQVRPSPLDTTS